VESLIGCGAFDEVEPERCQALARYFASRGRASFVEEPVLGLEIEQNLFPVENSTDLRRRRMEHDVLGFSPLAHPLEFFDTSVQESLGLDDEGPGEAGGNGNGNREGSPKSSDYGNGIATGNGAGSGDGHHDPSQRQSAHDSARCRPQSAYGGAPQRPRVSQRARADRRQPPRRSRRASRTGVLAAKRYHKGKGDPIYFLTLDHPDGLTECVAPARVVNLRLKYGQAYTAMGTLQNRYGVSTLKVDSLMSLPESDF
jgi:hypothetical protein